MKTKTNNTKETSKAKAVDYREFLNGHKELKDVVRSVGGARSLILAVGTYPNTINTLLTASKKSAALYELIQANTRHINGKTSAFYLGQACAWLLNNKADLVKAAKGAPGSAKATFAVNHRPAPKKKAKSALKKAA